MNADGIDPLGRPKTFAVDENGHLLFGLGIPAYDYIDLTYTGDDLTGVVYKSGGTAVATLTLAYSGGKLVSVTKS